MKKYETFVLQNKAEMEDFIALLQSEGVKSYLELGSKFGGLLWLVGNALPVGSRIISIDLPWGDGSPKNSQPWLEQCVRDLNAKGYDAHLKIGDSHAAESVAFAEALGPFDCVMIDGDHTIEGVRADWENYGKLGKMVAFHDISWLPRQSKKPPVEVPAFWNELKGGYRHVEIRRVAGDYGIGVLWKN